jgi:hypothetical protein
MKAHMGRRQYPLSGSTGPLPQERGVVTKIKRITPADDESRVLTWEGDSTPITGGTGPLPQEERNITGR